MSGSRRERPGRDTFVPAWWCRSRHAQTAWGALARRRVLPTTRERFITADGDFVDVDWLAALAAPGAPLVLVLHGLEGSSRSHYVTGLLHRAARRGWRAAALNFRSCSGELNRLPRFYHSGDTSDLDELVKRLLAREPGMAITVVGVSLGGNVLLKWLGERGSDVPAALCGAVGISVPFDLEACARVLEHGVGKYIYSASFLKSMRAKVVAKAAAHPDFVDVAAVIRARTFAEYDRAVTAPLHGFADELDYWRRASSGPYLPRITRPTLLINALDDPFVPPHALPTLDTLPAHVRAEFTPRGGHGGFIQGRWPWRADSWAEDRALQFLATQLEDRAAVC